MNKISTLKSQNNLVSAGTYDKIHKIILIEEPEGIYIFIFENLDSKFPERDLLEDNFVIAKEICLEEYGVGLEDWKTYTGPSPR